MLSSQWRTSTLKSLIQGYSTSGESHSAALDENQEDKLDYRSIKIQSYTHLDENQEDKLVLSRMLQRVYILLHCYGTTCERLLYGYD